MTTEERLEELTQHGTVSITSPYHEPISTWGGVVKTLPSLAWRVDATMYVRRNEFLLPFDFSVSANSFDDVIMEAYAWYHKIA